MNDSFIRRSILAAAFGASLAAGHFAAAQTSAGAERQPADERPLIRQPSERSPAPAGAPSAGDTRALPGGDARPPASAAPRQDRRGAHIEPRTGSALGGTERRPDGPDADIAQSGVKP
jgi:hypothetical protein